MRCDGTCDLNWKNETRPKKEATNCQNFKLPCWSLALNTEACVIKKELDRIEQVAELFLEKPGWHLKLKIIPLGAFWSFFFVFAFSSFGFVSMLNITVSVTRSFYSKKNPHSNPLLKFDWKVWEVKLWKMDPSTGEKGPQIAESRVTLLSNLPLPEEHKNAGDALRKYTSKL